VLVAAAIFFIVAAAIVFTARDPGLTWDEAIYCGFSLRYLTWFSELSADAFTAPKLAQFWLAGQVHPPLGKLWITLSFISFGNAVDLITAARMGAAILFALTAAVLYLWVADRRGDPAGLIAAATFVLMPRLFAHGHFANLEMPMVLLWLLTTIAFERGIRSRNWSLLCGVLFGLALLTKVNALFLPVVLLPWGFVFHGRKAFRNLIAMAVIGPLLFLAGWPAMWHAPLKGPWAYLADKADRAIIPTHYLGVTYGDRFAPFHYPFVMLLATTPLLVLMASAIGIGQFTKKLNADRRKAPREALLLWSFGFPLLLLAMPGVPKYDGIRLMLPAYPFLAALAAEGAVGVWERVRSRFRAQKSAAWRLGVVCAFWLLLPVVLFHPFQLCYYGELAGGPWGARKLGFETTYWNETLDPQALAYLDKHVPEHGSVALVAVGSLVWQYYPAMGEVRKDIRLTDFDRGDWHYLVVIPRQGMLAESVTAYMATHQPAWVNTLAPFGSPPVCLIYGRDPGTE